MKVVDMIDGMLTSTNVANKIINKNIIAIKKKSYQHQTKIISHHKINT